MEQKLFRLSSYVSHRTFSSLTKNLNNLQKKQYKLRVLGPYFINTLKVLNRFRKIQANKQLASNALRINHLNMSIFSKRDKLPFELKLQPLKRLKLIKTHAATFPIKFKKPLLKKVIKGRRVLNFCLRKLLLQNIRLEKSYNKRFYPYIFRTSKFSLTYKASRYEKKLLHFFLTTLTRDKSDLSRKYSFKRRFGIIIGNRSRLIFLLKQLKYQIKEAKTCQKKNSKFKRKKVQKLSYHKIRTFIKGKLNVKKHKLFSCKILKNDYKAKKFIKREKYNYKYKLKHNLLKYSLVKYNILPKVRRNYKKSVQLYNLKINSRWRSFFALKFGKRQIGRKKQISKYLYAASCKQRFLHSFTKLKKNRISLNAKKVLKNTLSGFKPTNKSQYYDKRISKKYYRHGSAFLWQRRFRWNQNYRKYNSLNARILNKNYFSIKRRRQRLKQRIAAQHQFRFFKRCQKKTLKDFERTFINRQDFKSNKSKTLLLTRYKISKINAKNFLRYYFAKRFYAKNRFKISTIYNTFTKKIYKNQVKFFVKIKTR
jgi:hypothetical protein